MEFLDISSIDGSDHSIYSPKQGHGREILIISISVGLGRTEEITIHEHDTPKYIAHEFCKKHNLNPEAEKVIIEVIKDHLRVKPKVEVSKLGENPEKVDEPTQQPVPVLEKTEPKIEVKPRAERNSMDFSKISRGSIRGNCGERLYNEGMIQREKYERRISEIREKITVEQMKENTFRPSITPDQKMERLSLIGPESKQPPPGDRCHLLYNKSRDSLSRTKSPPRFHSNSPNYSQKVLNSRKHLQHYLEQKEQARKTPKKFQSPGVNRDQQRKIPRCSSHERKVKLSNEQTDRIINRIKTIRFVQLFENLNPNEHQEIDAKTVESPKLSKMIIKILRPFLEELRSLSYGLTLEQFCKVMELYIRDLTPEERSTLLQIGKKKKNQSLAKNMTLNKDMVNDLWSPKHEEKLLVFEQFPECS